MPLNLKPHRIAARSATHSATHSATRSALAQQPRPRFCKPLCTALVVLSTLATLGSLATTHPAMACEAHHTQQEVSAIQQRIATTYDTPNAKVNTQPVVVEGRYALANWLQDSRGGRALLQKNAQDQWEIMACGGDGFKNPKVLQQAGLPRSTAQALISKLQSAEKTMTPAQLKTISAFDAHAQHQQHQHQHQPQHQQNQQQRPHTAPAKVF